MNERIKQMCEHSKAYSTECTKDFTGDEPVEWMDYYTEKFAELIVQECIDIIAPYSVRMSKPGEQYLHPIQEIKEHFGVQK